MFTGIVEDLGTIQSISRGSASLTLCINCSFAKELVLGESVAVNGTCLTVTEKTDSSFCADVTPESFRRTSLGELSNGSYVNLERAMKADGRFGGHIVSGHVDGTGRIVGTEKEENAVNVTVAVNGALGKYIIEKGSVCVDGISLTVANVNHSGSECIFSIAVIPHTWSNTSLCKKESGAVVNIECDVVGKYIEHFLHFDSAQSASTANGESKDSMDEATMEFMTNFPSFH